jgi:hypothetical protein
MIRMDNFSSWDFESDLSQIISFRQRYSLLKIKLSPRIKKVIIGAHVIV